MVLWDSGDIDISQTEMTDKSWNSPDLVTLVMGPSYRNDSLRTILDYIEWLAITLGYYPGVTSHYIELLALVIILTIKVNTLRN